MDKVRIKINYIIVLIDEFTNEMISSNEVMITANNKKPSVIKEGKYYIFTDGREDNVCIVIEKTGYERVEQCITMNRDLVKGNQLPLVYIRLQPDASYQLPADYKRTARKGEPFEEIKEIKDQEQIYRLIKDYSNGDQIEMICEEKNNIVGKTFRIIDERNQLKEDFTIIKQERVFEYRMNKCLVNSYDKENSKLFELYCTRADENGNGYVIIKGLQINQ